MNTPTPVINFGKHNGLTYQQLLDKDINYCLWLASLRYTNDFNKPVIDWLKAGALETKLNTIKNEKIAKEMARVVL